MTCENPRISIRSSNKDEKKKHSRAAFLYIQIILNYYNPTELDFDCLQTMPLPSLFKKKKKIISTMHFFVFKSTVA